MSRKKGKYRLKPMDGERAKELLRGFLATLSGIEVEHLTTFDLDVLHRCAENPPLVRRGCEELILDGDWP